MIDAEFKHDAASCNTKRDMNQPIRIFVGVETYAMFYIRINEDFKALRLIYDDYRHVSACCNTKMRCQSISVSIYR